MKTEKFSVENTSDGKHNLMKKWFHVQNLFYSTQFPAKNLKIVSGITEFENENNTIVVALWSCRYSSRCAMKCKQTQDMPIIHYGLVMYPLVR
jgi:hypothetical protein